MRTFLRCSVYVVIGVVIAAVLFEYGPRSMQEKRMQGADTIVRLIDAELFADKRYQRVSVHLGTGEGAHVVVDGTVAEDDDLDSLKVLIGEYVDMDDVFFLVRVLHE